jgi:hypothetical protein
MTARNILRILRMKDKDMDGIEADTSRPARPGASPR